MLKKVEIRIKGLVLARIIHARGGFVCEYVCVREYGCPCESLAVNAILPNRRAVEVCECMKGDLFNFVAESIYAAMCFRIG